LAIRIVFDRGIVMDELKINVIFVTINKASHRHIVESLLLQLNLRRADKGENGDRLHGGERIRTLQQDVGLDGGAARQTPEEPLTLPWRPQGGRGALSIPLSS
jgi:hypothetical protein